MQIGDFHIGSAESAKETILSAGEAHMLWNQLVSRYDCIEKTQIYYHFVHDVEFKTLLAKELGGTLEKEADQLEKILNKYKMPLPYRPPKSSNLKINAEIMSDRYIFRDIMTGCENFVEVQLHAIRSFVTNDPLRRLFVCFLKQEVDILDNMYKYGKIKGWFEVPPMMH